MPTTAPHPDLLDEAALMAWTGFRQRTGLEAHLRKLRIAYGYGKGGRIITTIQAVNASLIGPAGATIPADAIDFE